MVEWYFYLEKGEAKGPLEKDDVISSMKQGKFGPLDLFYRQGQKKWLPAFQMQEFNFLFDEKTKDETISKNRREWIILKKQKDPTRPSFKQLGPFTQKELMSQLNKGETKFDDYAWRTGFEKWTPLKDIEDFKKVDVRPAVPPLFPDEEVKRFERDVGKNFLEDSLFKPSVKDERPPGAGTADLTRPWEADIDLEQTKTYIRPVAAVAPETLPPEPPPKAVFTEPTSPSPAAPTPAPEKFKEERRKKRGSIKDRKKAADEWLGEIAPKRRKSDLWMARMFMLALSLGFVFVILVLASGPQDYDLSRLKKILGMKESPDPVVAAPPAVPPKAVPPKVESSRETPPPAIKAEPAKPAVTEAKPAPPVVVPPTPAPEKPAVPSRKPDKLSARLQGENLEVVTNGSFHFPLRVQIFGQAGKIVAGSGLYHDSILKWKAGESPQLSLRRLRLPRGDYVVRVSFEDLAYVTGMSWNPGTPDSFASMKAAKKAQVLAFNRERRDLLGLTERLESRALELEANFARHRKDKARWGAFIKDWKKAVRDIDKSYFATSLSQRTLPWFWYKLGDKKSELQRKSEAYDLNAKAGVEISPEVQNINTPQEMKELKEEISQLKLF